MRRWSIVLLLLLLAVLAFGGCRAKSRTEEASQPLASQLPIETESDSKADAPAHRAQPSRASTAGGAAKSDQAAKNGAAEAVTTWKRSQLASHTVRLSVGDNDTLAVGAMQAQVRIDGFRARVVLDYLFFNDRTSRLEGTFQLRLPNDASPYYLAFGQLDTKTPEGAVQKPVFFTTKQVRQMGSEPLRLASARATSWLSPKEARMVPKEKAAFAYTSTVQRRVDPAIMEWAGAGIFNTRVFPIEAKKAYRVVVGYDVDLVAAGDDLTYEFDVPPSIQSVTVDLGVATIPGAKVSITPAGPQSVEGGRTYARFEGSQASPITVRLAGAQAPLLVGTLAETGPAFASSFQPHLPSTPATTKARRAVFAVDTSLSSNPDRYNIWLRLLRATLNANRDTMGTFGVVFFGIDTHWWNSGFTDNTPENVEAMLTYAAGLSLEGATDLGAGLEEAVTQRLLASRDERGTSDIFLLSDGASTWGENDTQKLARALRTKSATLFAYNTGTSGTDSAALTLLARESGGAVFSVAGEAEVDAASRAHRSRPFRIVNVALEGATDILLGGRPHYLFPGQRVTLAGRGTPAAEAKLAITLEYDGKQYVQTTRLGPSLATELAPRIYGQIAVNQLEELGDATSELSKPYATHFRITGQTCSLLMLDSKADYDRFNIRPEADSFAIKQNPVSAAIAQTLEKQGATLGDPKVSLQATLAKLERTPGMTFSLSASLRAALEAMPPSSFTVPSAALTIQKHDKDSIPPGYLAALQGHKLDYDAVEIEAMRRAEQSGKTDGLRALSSLVEENPGDTVLARDIGYSAMQLGLFGQAYHLFRRTAEARPYEPQNYRAMAQSLAGGGQTDLALLWFEVGLAGQFNTRFGEFRRILAMDYQRFLSRIERGELRTSVPEFAQSRLSSLRTEFPVPSAELVVMITWNTDATDVDLHVLEPSGEDCYYAHRQTAIGGSLTSDVTRGYGPEMYVLPRAHSGEYRISAHYFASDQARTGVRTKVYATVFENWGTPKERVIEKVVKLELGKSKHEIAVLNKTAKTLEIAR